MIRLDPHRYDGFKDIYFNAVYKLFREMEISEPLHFPGVKYAVAPGLVWYLCDYDLYPCLTGKKTGFDDLCPEKSEIEKMPEDSLKEALRPLILGKVEILRKARELLLRGWSREIGAALSDRHLKYDAEKKELCCDDSAPQGSLAFIPYGDEKTLRDRLEKSKGSLDDDRGAIYELLVSRWSFLEAFCPDAYTRLSRRKLGSESLPWKHMSVSASLVKLLELRSCPYCNRNFIGTTGKKNLGYQLDHYINKSMYPFFCVSLYNLVPSCGVCNGGKSDTDDPKILSPFEECAHYDTDLDFLYVPPLRAKDQKGTVEIAVNPGTEKEMADRYEKTMELFELNTCYEFNAADADAFIRKMIYYPPSMIEELGRTMCRLGNSVFTEQMIEETIFSEGMEEEETYHSRPLSMMYRHLYRKYRE